MKRTIVLFGALLLTASASFLGSCKKKKYNNTDQLATLSSATVSGCIFARLVDTAGAADSQYVPSGTVITAWIDSKELLYYTDNEAPYARRYYTGSVGANGKYSIIVDVSLYRNANVHIEPQAFSFDHIERDTKPPYKVIAVNRKYTADPITTSVEKNETDTLNVSYQYK